MNVKIMMKIEVLFPLIFGR